MGEIARLQSDNLFFILFSSDPGVILGPIIGNKFSMWQTAKYESLTGGWRCNASPEPWLQFTDNKHQNRLMIHREGFVRFATER